jgi:hypothetical protein
MTRLALDRTRLSGIALVAGGALSIAGYVLTGTLFGSGDDRFAEPLFTPLYGLALAGVILTLLGLPAILAAHGERAARLTLIGYVGTFAALAMLNLGEGVIEGFVKPYFMTHGGTLPDEPTSLGVYFLIAFLFVVVGVVSLGIAVIRAKVFPGWAGALLIAAVPLSFVGPSLPGPLAETPDYLLFVALITFGRMVAWPTPRARSVAAGAEAAA